MDSAFAFSPIQSDASSGAVLYQSSAFVAGSNNVWCGFFIPSAVTKAVPLSAADSWNAPNGCYIFCAEAPDSDFLQNIIQYRASLNTVPIVQTFRFVFWFINPNPGANMLNADQAIPFEANMQSSSGYTTAQHVSYLFSTISVEIDSLTVIGMQPNADGSSCLYISNSNAQALRLKGSQNTSFLGQFLTPIQIQLQGIETGRLAFQTSMILQMLNINNDFEMLDVSIRYFYNTQSTGNSLALTNQRYRLFGIAPSGSATISFNANLDVFYPLNPANTFFAFIPVSGEMVTLNTYFSTSSGQLITLTPVANNASLVFATSRDDNGNLMYYLTPAGDFTIGGITGNSPSLLCGLAGTETISLTSESLLSFSPGQAAFVEQFPLIPVTSNTPATPLLSTAFTTAWIGIKNATPTTAPISYVSQATGAAIHTNNKQVAPYLGYYPALTANLNVATAWYPFVPYGYTQPITPAAAELLTTFETQVISTTRKSIIAAVAESEHANPGPGDTIITGTTPQGLLIQLDTTTIPNSWEQLTLANNAVIELDHTGNPVTNEYTLQFENVAPPLQSALQSNQLFLVVSTNAYLGTLTPENNINPAPSSTAAIFYNLMSIQGWPFTLNVPAAQQPGNYNNVLIFKFCSGALIDRMGQSSLWTDPQHFNDPGNLNNLSSWISNYINDGVNQYKQNGDSNFANFYDIVTSPTWNGVLALNVDIDVQEFPLQLQGLLGGIDLSLFRAHHFGININMVTSTSGVLAMEPQSSLFGLINYIDQYYPNEPADTTDDFAFKVLFLKVLFENSCINNFQSKIQLTINKFFGSAVIDETDNGNEDPNHTLILDGHYENHNGLAAYTFNETGDNIFTLDNNVLNSVEIIKSSFSTLVPQPGGSDTMVNSCFSLWGFMNFNSLAGFDSFSFGPEINDPFSQNGLNFSNLNIRMSFDMRTPSVKIMSFDSSQIAFDTLASYSRTNSLYSHFPIKLTGLTSGDQHTTPTSLGFLPLSISSLTGANAPSNNWYGLIYTLDLGTPGALAADAGFVATVLLTWGTDSLAANTSLGTMAGLKIPGASAQSKLLSLQNVLKLDFGSLELSVQENSTAYILKINDIALKFLGLKIPSGDKFNFMLFGDPGATSSPTSLGWFAAYNNS